MAFEAGRWKARLDVLASLAMIGAATALIWSNVYLPATASRARAIPLPTAPLELGDAETIGERAASVTVVEFSDFQCPFCGSFAREVMPLLRSEYVDNGKILFAFRNMPLSIHPFARPAAEAAVCAGAQGKFWQLHDRFFADQTHLAAADLAAKVKAAKLDQKSFANCLGSIASDRVRRDEELGKALRIAGTPTFFLGRTRPGARVEVKQMMSGNKPLQDWRAALDSLLQKKS